MPRIASTETPLDENDLVSYYTGMVAPLIEPYNSDATLLRALMLWRECRGESIEGKRAVNDTLQNRCKMAPREGFKLSARENILKPWAFSSFMMGDPNSLKYPALGDVSWPDCLRVAAEDAGDSVQGAVFYHDSSLKGAPHAWGAVQHACTIGRLSFYRIHHPVLPGGADISKYEYSFPESAC